MDELDKILAANTVISTYLENSDLDDAMICTALVLLLAQMISYVDTPVFLEATIEQLRGMVTDVNNMQVAA